MSSLAKSSTLPSCFRPHAKHRSTTELPPVPAIDSGSPNLTTSVYKTSHGLFALTWFRNVLGRSLHLHVLVDAVDGGDMSSSSSSLSTPSFSLNLKPLIFWNRTGFKKLNLPNNKSKCIQIFWDFSRAKFGSQPEPISGYYVAAVIDGSISFLAGDSPAEAYSKTKSAKSSKNKTQSFILRREHVYGNKMYTTKAEIGGRTREINIDCRTGDDPRLYFSVDQKRVLQIKHLKWKFRGNDRIEIEGINVQISWDVYNWLFEEDNEDGYALFMFRFEKVGFDEIEEDNRSSLIWSQQSCGFGFEKMKMRKGLLRSSGAARSSSSSSLSSASSSCSSVMEWASMEENELKGPSGFSLLVYAWKS